MSDATTKRELGDDWERDIMLDEINELQAEIAHLREKLNDYGRHRRNCGTKHGQDICSCGFADQPEKGSDE